MWYIEKINDLINNEEQGKIRQFCKNVKEQKNVFNMKLISCRDEKGDILSNKQNLLQHWLSNFKGPSVWGDLLFDFLSVNEIVRQIVHVEGNLTEFLS